MFFMLTPLPLHPVQFLTFEPPLPSQPVHTISLVAASFLVYKEKGYF